jgi:hypothetical protein
MTEEKREKIFDEDDVPEWSANPLSPRRGNMFGDSRSKREDEQ